MNEEPNGPGASPTAVRRKKSTGFPVVSLSEAATILKEAGKYGFEHSTAAFASYMGHTSTNSGAFRQRLAAFRDWKLITGRGDSLAMTDIARMIALPTDDVAERRALQAAFMNSPMFCKLYEGSAKGQPLAPDRLGSRAVHEFGVAPSSADKFAQSFTASAVAAGLAEQTEAGQIVFLQLETDAAPADQLSPESRAHVSGQEPVTPGRTHSLTRQTPPPVVHQAWEIDGGTITFEIRTANPLPASAFVTVGEVVASLERLATTLTPEPGTGASHEDTED